MIVNHRQSMSFTEILVYIAATINTAPTKWLKCVSKTIQLLPLREQYEVLGKISATPIINPVKCYSESCQNFIDVALMDYTNYCYKCFQK